MTGDTRFLQPFSSAGVLTPTETHLIETVSRLQPEADPASLLALGVASRGVRLGHACLDLGEISNLEAQLSTDSIGSRFAPGPPAEDRPTLPWPDPSEWLAALQSSPIVASPESFLDEPLRPLVLDSHRIYLQRYFSHEVLVADEITRRGTSRTRPDGIGEILDELFGPESGSADPQRLATEAALGGGLTIITGGPGTGKTYTIARILAGAVSLADRSGHATAHALAAPTGRAAARINESLADLTPALSAVPTAITIHSLLGWAPGDGFRHNRSNPLPHDLLIIDETSMISLSLMARLLEAVRPDASLVLVGDPDQLTSVDVGTVLSDIVAEPRTDSDRDNTAESPPVAKIVRLTRAHRFGDDSAIAALASTVRAGDFEAAVQLLAASPTDHEQPIIEWIQPDHTSAVERLIGEVVEASISVTEAALAGDSEAAVTKSLHTKVLAATRANRFGLHHWSDLIESSVVARVPGVDNSRQWFAGRPVMITANDRINRVANGDTGIVVTHHGGLAVALASDGSAHSDEGVRFVPTSRLSEVESWWAMTIHKSQGSEFRHVVVSLPPPGTPILNRELLYTAITRARERVTIVADPASLREAIDRAVSRASGLASRLGGRQGSDPVGGDSDRLRNFDGAIVAREQDDLPNR